jgi:hypothetical protein
MRVKQVPWADELTRFYEAALLELPFCRGQAAVRRRRAGLQ